MPFLAETIEIFTDFENMYKGNLIMNTCSGC